MIGIFDSGYGGLAILRGLVSELPEFDYLYLGDNARAPYGDRSKEEIFDFTKQGVQKLFDKGCDLVILACNTASSSALRRLQQEWLPSINSKKRVLGILVPTVEQISENGSDQVVGVLATTATVDSLAYVTEIHNINRSIKVVQQACPNLSPKIERGATKSEIREEVRECLKKLMEKHENPDAILLGCTHYGLILDIILKEVPSGVKIYAQHDIVAKSLADYLERHSELKDQFVTNQKRIFLTTGDPDKVSKFGSFFFGEPIGFKKIYLS